jgi:hypothetical protein
MLDRGAFGAGAATAHGGRTPTMPLAATSAIPIKEKIKSNNQKQVNKTI